MSLESQLQSALLLAAPARIPDLRLFRRNIGEAKLRGGYTVQFGIPGQCDLYGIVRGGSHLEVELKGVKTPMSVEQRVWAEWCAEWGIPHIVLRAKKDETISQTVDRWCLELRELAAVGIAGSTAKLM